ncbi:hypothetical protein B0H13DRAFT_860411 [Mycena leptocephala]|nr:hypothetical protein B0H13DRAFT_860411 [Mycena leptocephala]
MCVLFPSSCVFFSLTPRCACSAGLAWAVEFVMSPPAFRPPGRRLYPQLHTLCLHAPNRIFSIPAAARLVFACTEPNLLDTCFFPRILSRVLYSGYHNATVHFE